MKSLKQHRFKINPLEEHFVDEFLKENSEANDMNFIVFGQKPDSNIPKDYLSEREEAIVISVIQWLGSPVGQSFYKRTIDKTI
jgi:hypothetical protein